MEENKKINADELKEETKETFNKVKSEIKDADFKEETKHATNFVKEMIFNPIGAVKDVASGNGPKLITIILLVIAILGLSVIDEIVSMIRYSSLYDGIGDLVMGILHSITRPAAYILVPAIVVLFMNAKEKKSLLVNISTVSVAYVTEIFSTIVVMVARILGGIPIITNPVTAALGALNTVLLFFGLKTLIGDEEEGFVIKFIIIEAITALVIFLLSNFNLV